MLYASGHAACVVSKYRWVMAGGIRWKRKSRVKIAKNRQPKRLKQSTNLSAYSKMRRFQMQLNRKCMKFNTEKAKKKNPRYITSTKHPSTTHNIIRNRCFYTIFYVGENIMIGSHFTLHLMTVTHRWRRNRRNPPPPSPNMDTILVDGFPTTP